MLSRYNIDQLVDIMNMRIQVFAYNLATELVALPDHKQVTNAVMNAIEKFKGDSKNAIKRGDSKLGADGQTENPERNIAAPAAGNAVDCTDQSANEKNKSG